MNVTMKEEEFKKILVEHGNECMKMGEDVITSALTRTLEELKLIEPNALLSVDQVISIISRAKA
ncbi:hypothetical protein VP381E491_P0072 [Vibrio phage 381E49-1]|nr:hypothetical protein VP381E491_P0072 [Vibrio phage 381E49-1]